MTDRRINRNEPIPTTPQRENGFRAYAETVGPDLNKYGIAPQKRIHRSPLFETRAEAETWTPE